MPVFFISYRRADLEGKTLAHMLYRELTNRYGPRAAFFDVDQRRPGIPFPVKVQQALDQSDVMLAVMGSQWLDILRQRQDDERDWVRHEISRGLARGDEYPVVPVLCPGVPMPSASQLPEDLKDLQWRDGVIIDPYENFRPHIEKALQDIEAVLADLGEVKARREQAGAQEAERLAQAQALARQAEEERERQRLGVERERTALEEAARKQQEAREAAVRATQDRPFTNSLGMPFVPVPGTDVLMSLWETRVQDYAAFAAANTGVDGSWKNVEYKGHKQGPDHPVVNVSWEDAKAFCAWLSQKEGKTCRLPTDHEWSLAVGIGDREDPKASPESKNMKIQGVYPWGAQWPPPKGAGNYSGQESAWDFKIDGYRDDHPFTAPVGSYNPNKLGFFDLGGNVWEWCEDFYDGKSGSRVLRGASWLYNVPNSLLSSYRRGRAATCRDDYIGFRVVMVGSGER